MDTHVFQDDQKDDAKVGVMSNVTGDVIVSGVKMQ